MENKPIDTKMLNLVVKDDHIYGLGDDNKVYFWDASQHAWFLWG